MVQQKVDFSLSCKVPRLKDRREAEQNSDRDDDEVDNGKSEDEAAVSVKKDCIF